jgi:hypothetical protein
MKRDKNNKNDAYSTMNVILRICLSIYAHIPEAKPHAKNRRYTRSSNIKNQKKREGECQYPSAKPNSTLENRMQ